MVTDLRSVPPSPPSEAADHTRVWSGSAAGAARVAVAGARGVSIPFPEWALCFSSYGGACYCPMLAVDMTGFTDRGEDVQRFLRGVMYEVLTNAFASSGLCWQACHHEDRGDGVLVVAPPGAPATVLVDPLVDHVRAEIRRHNKMFSDLAKISLRMSVHAGQVHFDENGVSGNAVNHLFRLLEAATFKRAFAASGCSFALVTSQALYEDVISQGPGLVDPDMYAPINVRCKETRTRAWIYLPPVRNPFLGGMSAARSRVGAGSGATRRPGASQPGQPSQRANEPPSRRREPAAALDEVRPLLPRPRTAERHDAPAKDSMSARARIIAANAMTTSRRLASSVPTTAVHARVRERLHPGQREQDELSS